MTSDLGSAAGIGRVARTLPLWLVVVAALAVAEPGGAPPPPEPPPASGVADPGCLILPEPPGAVRLRLYTDGSPDAPHLFNTFDLEGYGERLLASPDAGASGRSGGGREPELHSLLVDGQGPELAPANGLRIVGRAAGPDWQCVVLDGTGAYRRRLTEYRRAILFVAPDLFVVCDRATAREPASFRLVLHPPGAAGVDPVWGDLRLRSTGAVMIAHAPAPRKQTRRWAWSDPPPRAATATAQLGPTNLVTQFELLTVFAVHPAGRKRDYAFRLLEGDNAIGARIHRDGLPTLVAFKRDWTVPPASLGGFAFQEVAAVDVFKPKARPAPVAPSR